jgi:NADH-quinone oxidoreductase subunit E
MKAGSALFLCKGAGTRLGQRKKKVRKAVMDNDRIDKIIDKYPCDPSSLIQVLLEIQSENRWLPKEALKRVSERLKVPLNRIQHIITFYKAFSVVPKGRHEIHVCTGTACHVRGAPRILNAVQDVIGIKPGETDEELKFSLETVNCVGCCALGPVMVIDGVYYGKMAPAKSEEVLKNYE